MPPKKKQSKKRRATTKSKPLKKRIRPRQAAAKARSRSKPAKKKAAQEKTSARRSPRRTRASVNPVREIEREILNRKRMSAGSTASRQSDFQGLSRIEEADSESVDELVEEGNVFEAGAVSGVEEASEQDEKEVHTHEVLEDDVPDEYLEKE